MNKKEFLQTLCKLHACAEATKWVKTQASPAKAWENCQRGDWMWWWLRAYLDWGTPLTLEMGVEFAMDCANRAQSHLVLVTPTIAAADALIYANNAAKALANSTDGDNFNVTSPIILAVWVANNVAGINGDAAREEERKAQANWFRAHIPNPFIEEEQNDH